jgi:hypothetical protein
MADDPFTAWIKKLIVPAARARVSRYSGPFTIMAAGFLGLKSINVKTTDLQTDIARWMCDAVIAYGIIRLIIAEWTAPPPPAQPPPARRGPRTLH